ncbi:MAG: hypothetical protein WAW07_02195 [Bacteroidales bacterium]
MKTFYFRQESGTYFRTTYSIDSTNAKIIILGSSRANHSYVPEIFEDKFMSTCYNTGKDGNFILFNYAVFKAICNRYDPEIIIFDIRPTDLAFNAFEYDRLSDLLPYCHSHPEIDEIVSLRGPFEKIKQFSEIYPYNSMIFRIAMGNLNFNKTREQDEKGYMPFFTTMQSEKIDTLINVPFKVDEIKIDAIKDIISTCQQKNIALIFVFSPFWYLMQTTPADNILNELCSQNGIPFINMSNDSTFMNNPQYFADKSHLNDEGARAFSSLLIQKIKEGDWGTVKKRGDP